MKVSSLFHGYFPLRLPGDTARNTAATIDVRGLVAALLKFSTFTGDFCREALSLMPSASMRQAAFSPAAHASAKTREHGRLTMLI